MRVELGATDVFSDVDVGAVEFTTRALAGSVGSCAVADSGFRPELRG